MLLDLLKVESWVKAKKSDWQVHYWLKIAGPFETLMFCSLWSDNPSLEQQNAVRGDRNALMHYPAENVNNLMLPNKSFLSHLVQHATRKSTIKSQLLSELKGRCSALGRNSEAMSPAWGLWGERIAPRDVQKLRSYQEKHRYQITHLNDSSPCFG